MSAETHEGVTVPCCGCSGKVTFVVPKANSDHPTLLHTMPYCKRFEETNTGDDIVKYVQDCRIALEGN